MLITRETVPFIRRAWEQGAGSGVWGVGCEVWGVGSGLERGGSFLIVLEKYWKVAHWNAKLSL